MKPEDVPAEIVAAAAMALAFHPNAFLVDPDGTALRTLLADVLPAHERMVRERVAAEIETVADRDGDGSPWDHGMQRAAEIARGPQPVATIGGFPADHTHYPADLEAVRRPQDAPTAPAQPAAPAIRDTETTGSTEGGTSEMTDAEEWALAKLTRRCNELSETAERYRQSWNAAAERAEQAERERATTAEAYEAACRISQRAEAERDRLTTLLAQYADRGIANGQRADRYRTAWWSARIRAAELRTERDLLRTVRMDALREAALILRAEQAERDRDRLNAILATHRDYLDNNFRYWCSPHGVAADYATKLIAQLDALPDQDGQ